MSKGFKRIAITFLLVHLALSAALALFNPHVHWLDDAYYTMTIARNIAQGDGISYGGFPTNGFQPLLGFLMAPIQGLLGNHPEFCLKISLLTMAFCSTALLLVILLLTRQLAGEQAAVIAGALYVANANLLRHALSGLETPLHGLLFWLFVFLYLRFRENGTIIQQAALGFLLGFTAYARLDAIWLFLAVAADIAWRCRRQPVKIATQGTLFFLPALGLLSPWLIWNWITFGTIMQSPSTFHRWRAFVRQDIPETAAGMIKFAVLKLTSLGLKLPFEPLFGYEGVTQYLAKKWLGVEKITSGFLVQLLQTRPLTAALFMGCAALILIMIIVGGKAGLRRLKNLRPLAFLLVALAGAALFYPLYLLNYSMRHFFPYSVGMVLVLAAFFSAFAEIKCFQSKAARHSIVVFLAVVLALPGLGQWVQKNDPLEIWNETKIIETVTEPGAKIGYTDCGAFGYYVKGRTIVNLDGILNFEALAAMKSGDIGDYLVRHNIKYVLYLHNFTAEYAEQWNNYILPRVEPVAPADWIYRLKGIEVPQH